MRLPSVVVFAALLLAGCSSEPPADRAPTAGPSVITDPTMGLNQTGAHIHDYWGGGDRVTVIDSVHAGGDEPGTGPGVASGPDVEVRSFQPESGDVVPQGTASIEVTFTWTADDLDMYTDPVLYLKTAGDNAATRNASVESGVMLSIPANATTADLPHQLLSAWLFELRMSSPDPMPLRFKGSVALKVDAVRGDDPLPVFPAHPDRWGGKDEIALVDAEGQLAYWEDTGDGGCNGQVCPQILRPVSGAIVPGDAAKVVVELTYTGEIELELHFHGSLARELGVAEPSTVEAGRSTYELLVDDAGGDGPYAAQSQWEFTVLPAMTGPVRTAWFADYTVDAKAVKA